MPSVRLSKYDPSFRNALGHYTRDEWTSFADIGQRFNGQRLEAAAYQVVEDAYIDVAVAFWEDAGRPSLLVRDRENSRHSPGPDEGDAIEAILPTVLRALLRETFWCRLETADRTIAIHAGYDFYLYLVGPISPRVHDLAGTRGLFLEPFVSPYLASGA